MSGKAPEAELPEARPEDGGRAAGSGGADAHRCCWGRVRAKSAAAALAIVESILVTLAMVAVPMAGESAGKVAEQLALLAVDALCLWAALYGLCRDRAFFLWPLRVFKEGVAGICGARMVAGLVVLIASSAQHRGAFGQCLLVLALLAGGFVYNLCFLLVLIKAQAYIRDKAAHYRDAGQIALAPYPVAHTEASPHVHQSPPAHTPSV